MRMHLASTEPIQHYYCAKLGGASNFLMSYYYAFFGKKSTARVMESLRNDPSDKWIMDSGLFTMMFGSASSQTYTQSDLETYMLAYIDTMHAISFQGAIVEMDVHKVLGLEALAAFRRVFEERWPLDRTIYVWHVEEKIAGLKAMAERYPYIAFSVPELRKVVKHTSMKQYIEELLVFVHKINPKIRVHLLGNTQLDLLNNSLYFSCDSSSWIKDEKFGTCTTIRISGETAKYQSFHRKLDGVMNLDALFKHAIGSRTIRNQEVSDEIHRKVNCKALVVSAANYVQLERYINERFYPHELLPSAA